MSFIVNEIFVFGNKNKSYRGLQDIANGGQIKLRKAFWIKKMHSRVDSAYINYMFPLWAWPYDLGIWASPGSVMGLHMGKPLYIAHWGHMDLLSGPHIWVLYGQARIHPTLVPYGLAIWASHESFMGVPIWYGQSRIHHTRGPHGLAIWVIVAITTWLSSK